MKRDLGLVAFGLLAGLLSSGLLYLAIAEPRGRPVQLSPPPTPAPLVIYVTGAVLQPGVYSLPAGSRTADAVQAAGGLSGEADPLALNLAAPLSDGYQLVVPASRPAQPPATRAEAIPSLSNEQPAPLPQPAPPGLVNVNTASQAELETLPGIGPVTAAKIIAHRQANGAFQTAAAIMDVKGIGPVTYERIKDLITIGP